MPETMKKPESSQSRTAGIRRVRLRTTVNYVAAGSTRLRRSEWNRRERQSARAAIAPTGRRARERSGPADGRIHGRFAARGQRQDRGHRSTFSDHEHECSAHPSRRRRGLRQRGQGVSLDGGGLGCVQSSQRCCSRHKLVRHRGDDQDQSTWRTSSSCRTPVAPMAAPGPQGASAPGWSAPPRTRRTVLDICDRPFLVALDRRRRSARSARPT